MAVKKLCCAPCCINYREEGSKYCSKHQYLNPVPFDGIKESPWAYLYRTKKWKDLKYKVLDEQPICAKCFKEMATEVHHVIPHRGNEDLFYDKDNLVALCHRCHTAETNKEIIGRQREH